MLESTSQRAILFANHIIITRNTVRETAKIFGVSKSTVHNDVSNKLKKVNLNLYYKVKKVLLNNFAEKHIRGGESTRIKYLNKKNN